MNRILHSAVWISIGVFVGLLFILTRPTAHAYPEYASRTGQQCTTCHVNPAGGGPRTLRGLLWIAKGRPDEVPPLPGGGTANEPLDGPGLFVAMECDRCHGPIGDGDVGPPLNQAELSTEQLTTILRDGVGTMKGFPPNILSDQDMKILIPYLQSMGRGEVEETVILRKRLLPPPQLICQDETLEATQANFCGGN